MTDVYLIAALLAYMIQVIYFIVRDRWMYDSSEIFSAVFVSSIALWIPVALFWPVALIAICLSGKS